MLFKSYKETGESLSITEEALVALRQHSWPGNVRELDNVIQRAKILSLGDKITIADLIFDNHEVGEQPNTADILAAKFKSSSTGEVVQ
jgi:DNA-binding NtrC family response regulator